MNRVNYVLTIASCLFTGITMLSQIDNTQLDSLEVKSELKAEPLSETAEVYPLKYPKAYWGNSFKLPIGDFAVAKIKSGIQNTSGSSKGGYQEDKTKYKFSAEISKDKAVVAGVKGKVNILHRYTMSSGGGLLDILTGVETETIGPDIDYSRILEAEISIKDNNEEIWVLVMKTTGQGSNFKLEEGSLTTFSRYIEIVQNFEDVPERTGESVLAAFDFADYVSFSYDFIENGKTIGSLVRKDQNRIILKQDLDLETKLLLMAAMVTSEE